MSFNITNAKDITKDNSTYLLYAAPGTGKTHTINYLEGRTLYVPIDKTQQPLAGNENIDVIDFNTHEAWEQWNELMKWLAKADLSEYDNIVLDNMSELYRSMLGNLGRVGKNDRVPTMMHYQRIDFFIIDSLRFVQTLKKRLVMTAWEMSDEWTTPTGQTFNRAYPDLRKTTMNNIMGLCQVVGRLRINERTEKRGFVLSPSDSNFAKNQLDERKFCLQEDIFKVGYVPDNSDEE